MSDSLQPHGLQHARLPCPSLTPRACSNSCPSSQWCHPTILFSVVPFSSCLQSAPASETFLMSQFFAFGGQSIEVLAFSSVLPMNIQNWFPLGLTGLISLQSKGLSIISRTTVQKHQYFDTQPSLWSSSHIRPYLTTGKTIALIRWNFVGKVTSLLFNMLCRFVISFLAKSKHLFISWLQSPSASDFGSQRNKVIHSFPIYLPWNDRTRCHNLMLEIKYCISYQVLNTIPYEEKDLCLWCKF